jgi:hypothetical protein
MYDATLFRRNDITPQPMTPRRTLHSSSLSGFAGQPRVRSIGLLGPNFFRSAAAASACAATAVRPLLERVQRRSSLSGIGTRSASH